MWTVGSFRDNWSSLESGHHIKFFGWLHCLRFVAAVSVSCSGDKSDKEESAGGFLCYGDYALQVQPWLARRVRFIALMIVVATVFTPYFCQLAFFSAYIGLFC